MAKTRSQDLYSSLYLYFARELGGGESSVIDFTERFPQGVWTTRAETGCGMYLHRPPLHAEPVYRKAPVNTVEFANTGGDGIFYSFLEADAPWSDDSPVVVTFPGSMGDDPSWIVGGSLREFLRLGRRVGFFSLGDLVASAINGDRDAITALTTDAYPEWISPDEAERLDRMAAKFRLKPLRNVPALLAGWQRRYRPLVRHEKRIR